MMTNLKLIIDTPVVYYSVLTVRKHNSFDISSHLGVVRGQSRLKSPFKIHRFMSYTVSFTAYIELLT